MIRPRTDRSTALVVAVALALVAGCTIRKTPDEDGPGPLYLLTIEASAVCPPGTEMKGAGPPKGYERYCETKAGVKNGPHGLWDPETLKPQELGSYIDGKRTGRWTTYLDGELQYIGEFRNDKQHGEFRAWHEGGGRQAVGQFRWGEPCGEFHCWAPAGEPAGCVPLDGICELTDVGAACPECSDTPPPDQPPAADEAPGAPDAAE